MLLVVFCLLGALCKNRHVRRVMCVNYLCGFCLDGPNCKFVQLVLFTSLITLYVCLFFQYLDCVILLLCFYVCDVKFLRMSLFA